MRAWLQRVFVMLGTLVILRLPVAAREGLPEGLEITATAHEVDLAKKVYAAVGKVRIKYEDMTVTADQASVKFDTLDFEAQGKVRVKWKDGLCTGKKVDGNLKSQTFQLGRCRARIEPWFVAADSATRNAAGVLRFRNVKLSTCEHLLRGRPHWHLQARRLVVQPNGDIAAHRVYLKFFNIPVFYLPRLGGNRHYNNEFSLSQGHTSAWGYWLRIGRKFKLGKYVHSRLFVESRSKRGVAVGAKTRVRSKWLNAQWLLYGMHDHEPLSDQSIGDQGYNSYYQTTEERFRIKTYTRFDFSQDLTLRVKTDAQSDNDMLFEFFSREFQRDPEPSSYVDLSWLEDRFEISFNCRPRLNSFNSTVERLPELRATMPRQQLGNSGLYYQNDNSAAWLRMNFRDYDLASNLPDDYTTLRADSAHVLYRPFKLGCLKILPRAAVRATAYSRSSETGVTEAELEDNFDADERRGIPGVFPAFSYDDDGGKQLRVVGEFGLEMSLKAHRTWLDLKSEMLGLDGLRHVLEPYANYTYIPDPKEDKDNLYFFDEVDRIDHVNMLRVGLKQRLQTRRRNETCTLLRLENYVDFFYNSQTDEWEDGEFGSILDLTPAPHFGGWVKTLMDGETGHVNAFNTGLRVGRSDRLHLNFNYLFQDDYTQRYYYSFGSDLTRAFSTDVFPLDGDRYHGVSVGSYIPLSAKTKLETEHFFDVETHELAVQRYMLTQDLHCWKGALGFSENDGEKRVELILYLKAFPKARIGIKGDG